MLAKIATGAQLYWAKEHTDSTVTKKKKGKKMTLTTNILPPSSKGYTPNKSWKRSCRRASGTFNPWRDQFKKEPWNSLQFWPTGTLRFRYRWRLQRQRTLNKRNAKAYAEAKADLRCNGKYTTFRVFMEQNKQTGEPEQRGPAAIEGL